MLILCLGFSRKTGQHASSLRTHGIMALLRAIAHYLKWIMILFNDFVLALERLPIVTARLSRRWTRRLKTDQLRM